MTYDMLTIPVVVAAFAAVFASGEILRRKFQLAPETTRKIVHFGGCMVALTFPLLFKSHWSVLALAAGFSGLIYLGGRFNFLHSINDVERKSHGGIYHPLAIYACFLLAQMMGHMYFYGIAIAVLALADSMAALVGSSYGRNKYMVDGGDRRSIEGSCIFFFATFLIVHLSLLLATETGRMESVLIAVLIAVLVTLFEAVSLGGSDNLFIPLGTLFILAKNVQPDTEEVEFQLAVLAATFAATLLLTMPYRKIGASGVAVLALAAYTAWGLVDFLWMLPVVYGVVLICHTGWFAAEPSAENTARVRTVFYLVLVPVLWVLAANIVWKLTGLKAHSLFFPPFAAALMAQLMISRVRLRGRAYSRIRLVAECCIFNLPLAAATLLAAGDWGERWLFAAGETAAVIATAAVYRHAFSRSRISPTALLRLRTALVLISSLLLMVLLLAHAELPEGWVR